MVEIIYFNKQGNSTVFTNGAQIGANCVINFKMIPNLESWQYLHASSINYSVDYVENLLARGHNVTYCKGYFLHMLQLYIMFC